MSSAPGEAREAGATGVAVDDDGAVRTVRIDRPAAMNALDVATKVALRDALQRPRTTRRSGASC